MIRIEDIVYKVKKEFPEADLDLLRRSYLFAAKEHKGQKLASGESYVVHPLEIANMLAELKLNEVCVGAGLLSNVLADSSVDFDTLRRHFGPEVTSIVDGAMKPIDSFDPSGDSRIGILKLVKRLATLKRLKYLPP